MTLGGAVSQTWYPHSDGRPSWHTVGLQLRRDRVSPLALHSTQARQTLSVTREDRVTVASVAPYVSSTVQWGSWLRSIVGARADFHDFSVDSNLAANAGKAHGVLVSPKLSLIFGPWAKTEYFINYGRGFHSNDARGTTLTVDPAGGLAAQRVAPLVRNGGYEAGVRSEIVPRLTLSAAAWQLHQDSELLFVGDAGTTAPARASRRKGLEVLAQYLPRPGITLDGSLALTHARFRGPEAGGNHVPGAPDRVAAMGITLDSDAGFFGALRWRYFGPRPLTEDGSVRSGSTALLNARVGYALSKAVKLQLDAYNVLNRKHNDIDYYYASRLAAEPAALSDLHLHPVEERAMRVTMVVSY